MNYSRTICLHNNTRYLQAYDTYRQFPVRFLQDEINNDVHLHRGSNLSLKKRMTETADTQIIIQVDKELSMSMWEQIFKIISQYLLSTILYDEWIDENKLRYDLQEIDMMYWAKYDLEKGWWKWIHMKILYDLNDNSISIHDDGTDDIPQIYRINSEGDEVEPPEDLMFSINNI